jgi:hypothetical protein
MCAAEASSKKSSVSSYLESRNYCLMTNRSRPEQDIVTALQCYICRRWERERVGEGERGRVRLGVFSVFRAHDDIKNKLMKKG